LPTPDGSNAEVARSTRADSGPIRALFLVDLGPIPARVVSAWCRSGHEIAAIWTIASLSRGAWKRDRRLAWFAPKWSVGATIRKYRIAHRRVKSLQDQGLLADLKTLPPIDVVVSVHFPRILPAALLSEFTVPAINLHPSLLPAYRGPTPLVSMVVDDAQDRCSGISIHAMVPRVDGGAIFASRPVPFPQNGSLRQWELDLACAAADLALAAIPLVARGELNGLDQSEEKTSYRSTTTHELKLTPSHSCATIVRLCQTLGRVRPLKFAVADLEYAVIGIRRHLGPPSGEPPGVGWFHIETDLADARVYLRRKPWWEGRRRRIETLLLQIFHSP
jgi:methionyl-tRNA formyltransferase